MRVLVRLLSTLLAFAVAVIGFITVIEVAWQWIRPADAPLLLPWRDWKASLDNVSWESNTLHLIAIGAAVVGLALMLTASFARYRAVKLTAPADNVSVIASPRALARLVGQRVRAQDNVTRASVTATAKKVRVRATSRINTENELRPLLITDVTELLKDLPLAKQPTVSVVVDSPRDRT